MMDTRKLVLRYLVVLQVYRGVHLVRSNRDADAASIPAKLCLPYDKSELDRYLKKLDTPEASMSNSGSSLSVRDTESLPFGALSVDWRRLRLLSDLSTLPKPGIGKISSDKDSDGVSESVDEEEAFLTTGNTRVPDEKRESTTHVRLHRSTLNNRNGNIDSTTMTVEPDAFDGWEEEVPSVTESETGVDVEENSGLTGIPMLEEVEKSTELITTKPLTTVFKNNDSPIEEIVTTEEIKPTISVSTQNYGEESTRRQGSESFSSTTEEPESPADLDVGTTKMTVVLKIGEPFSSVPKFMEHYGDREANTNRVSRVRNFGKSWYRHSRNRIDSGEDEALAKTRLSVFEPFDLGKKLRNRRPNKGMVKRGGHNTNTEKLFRWFYRGDRTDNSGKTDAEIKCIARS